MRKTQCSWNNCENPVAAHSRYCRAHKADYQRKWRLKNPLTGDALERQNARSYAHRYIRLGKLSRHVCDGCGAKDAQVHHEDCTKPLEVTWLCKECNKPRKTPSVEQTMSREEKREKDIKANLRRVWPEVNWDYPIVDGLTFPTPT